MNGRSVTKKELAFQGATFSVNILLISSVLLILFGLGWEYSTRSYLAGFSNAVLPYTSNPEKKVAAILAWMGQGPARAEDYYSDDSQNRDPVDTLNYKELLTVCGTATNAFVNLASAGGLEARRLLLLDAQGMNTNHVVAEVFLDGRWAVVDPSFHAILRGKDGHLLTRQELARPEVLREATRKIPGYDLSYNYEHTAFIHLARLPVVGALLQSTFNSVFPSWQERINWTVLVERQSYDTIVIGFLLLCFATCLRRLIFWYGRKISITPMNPWEQLRHVGVALFTSAPVGKAERSFPMM
jgi:transglutaminase superfamily protein